MYTYSRCFNQFRCWQTWPVSYFFREAWIGISGAWQFKKWKGLTWIVKSETLEEVLFQLATSVKSSIFKHMFTAFYVEVLFTFLEGTSWTVSAWVPELDVFNACRMDGWTGHLSANVVRLASGRKLWSCLWKLSNWVSWMDTDELLKMSDAIISWDGRPSWKTNMTMGTTENGGFWNVMLLFTDGDDNWQRRWWPCYDVYCYGKVLEFGVCIFCSTSEFKPGNNCDVARFEWHLNLQPDPELRSHQPLGGVLAKTASQWEATTYRNNVWCLSQCMCEEWSMDDGVGHSGHFVWWNRLTDILYSEANYCTCFFFL